MLTHNGKIVIYERDPKTWRARGGKKRKQPAMAQVIVTPPKLKPGRPKLVIRLSEQNQTSDNGKAQPRRSAIVEPKRKPSSIYGDAPDLTEEELQRRGDAAGELWRELVRRAALPESE